MLRFGISNGSLEDTLSFQVTTKPDTGLDIQTHITMKDEFVFILDVRLTFLCIVVLQ